MIPIKEIEKPFRNCLIGEQSIIITNDKTIEGKIIMESKNTLQIKNKNKIITIQKNGSIIKIKNITIEGKKITKRPQDRIKSK